jgi:hypothetical protein
MAHEQDRSKPSSDQGRKVTDIGGPSPSTREEVNIGNATDSPMERGPGQVSDPGKPLDQPGGAEGSGKDDQAGGITNRPLDEEQENQERLPPRGKEKGGRAS